MYWIMRSFIRLCDLVRNGHDDGHRKMSGIELKTTGFASIVSLAYESIDNSTREMSSIFRQFLCDFGGQSMTFYCIYGAVIH